MDRFEGKVAVVTGGAQGMGKAIAARLVREGAQGVVIADIEEIPLKHTCEELGEKVTGIVCDVRSKASVDAMVWKTMEKYGRIDVLFSNAGVCNYNLFLDETEENWDSNFDTNIKGMFFVDQAVAREMVKKGIYCQYRFHCLRSCFSHHCVIRGFKGRHHAAYQSHGA